MGQNDEIVEGSVVKGLSYKHLQETKIDTKVHWETISETGYDPLLVQC